MTAGRRLNLIELVRLSDKEQAQRRRTG